MALFSQCSCTWRGNVWFITSISSIKMVKDAIFHVQAVLFLSESIDGERITKHTAESQYLSKSDSMTRITLPQFA